MRFQPDLVHAVHGDDARPGLGQRVVHQEPDDFIPQRLVGILVAAPVAQVAEHGMTTVVDVELAGRVGREVVHGLQAHDLGDRADEATAIHGQFLVRLDDDEAGVTRPHLLRGRRHHAGDDRVHEADTLRQSALIGRRQMLAHHAAEGGRSVLQVLANDDVQGVQGCRLQGFRFGS